jgi:short-subunit dehydrogenase
MLGTAQGVKVEVLQADLEKENDLARAENVLWTNPAVRVLVNVPTLPDCNQFRRGPCRTHSHRSR